MNPTTGQCKGGAATARGRGPSSFWLQDPEPVFAHLALREDTLFVDAGCGAGEYALYAARRLGPTGRVVALDSSRESIDWLRANGNQPGAAPLSGHVCDITAAMPLETGQADVVMLATVLHIRAVRDRAAPLFREIARILRPGGTLAVLECAKKEANFGPPLHARLAPEDVARLAAPAGFRSSSVLLLEHTHLTCLSPG
ncbi:class I SAM-dependent methyltransferase [Desulfocurvus sp.]|jgi:ubiquinone/menaquinone biosynthesis C-methylase UbiE|uniref:class I SAM-dependent methyltransferase n=1 Tax=Desulfocurvus sp. TaxID=2871698 RepID=UPI0025BBA85A|nr:class I SAM-dependent methyltransferase [Desulfocurvus sp.]